MESLTTAIQTLMKTNKDFPQKFKQRLVLESHNVTNNFKFMAGLITEGVLSDGSSDTEASVGLKGMIVELAMMIVCSKGADAIPGLTKALVDSGNFELISSLRTWIKDDFAIETEGDISKLKGAAAAGQTGVSEKPAKKQVKSSTASESNAAKLIDRIVSRTDDDLMAELEGHWLGKASRIVNVLDFCSILAQQKVLNESGVQLNTGMEQKRQWAEKAIKSACSKKAIGSLVVAFQRSGNECILQETLEWIEAAHTRSKNHPIAVKSLTKIDQKPNCKRSEFFEQAAPLLDLEKVATFNCQPESSTTGTFGLEFNRDGMIVYLADGSVNLRNWRNNEEQTITFGAKLKVRDFTCTQYDEEICVLGTANGAVYLLNAKSLEAKWLIRLGEPVQSLKFLENTLVVVTRAVECDHFWWVDISRADMKLLNKRLVLGGLNAKYSEVIIHPKYSFLTYSHVVNVYDTESGRLIIDTGGSRWTLYAPTYISTFNVIDFISIKGIVVAGCTNGVIAMWNLCKFIKDGKPVMTFQGHTEAIVSLCPLNGHLLSADKSGKLLMWSGYDLERNDDIKPVPQLLADDFYNVNCMVAHERFFAVSSYEDSNVNIWTLPDLWLRAG